MFTGTLTHDISQWHNYGSRNFTLYLYNRFTHSQLFKILWEHQTHSQISHTRGQQPMAHMPDLACRAIIVSGTWKMYKEDHGQCVKTSSYKVLSLFLMLW